MGESSKTSAKKPACPGQRSQKRATLAQAGFAGTEDPADSYDIPEGVTVSFKGGGKGLTEKQKEELLAAMRLVTAGVKAQQEEE